MARSLADKSNDDRFRLRLATVMKKADELRGLTMRKSMFWFDGVGSAMDVLRLI
jgi:hypothetical protein